MDYNNRNIVLHELIGLRVRVLSSLDKKQKGLSGIVVDETKNTLVVETKSGVKRIVKNISQFRFYFGKESFKVDGREINFRPQERTGKAIRFYKRRQEKE
jgi:ribonuclease P protein subunit POP4